jgi:hypothetical protein
MGGDRLGPALADRLIAAKKPQTHGLRMTLLGIAGILLYCLFARPGHGRPARPTSAGAPVARVANGAAPLQKTAPTAFRRLNPSSAEARQQRALFETPPPDASACGYTGSAIAALSPAFISAHSRRGVVFGTLATKELDGMLRNFLGHLAPLVGECAIVVGMMDGGTPELALSLRHAAKAGVYSTAVRVGREGGQAGRWRHAKALFVAAAEARVDLVLSDTDVVWLRDPWPYLTTALANSPLADVLISTDSTNDWEKPVLPQSRMPGAPAELDLEQASLCALSLNIGIMLFRTQRRGAALLLDSAADSVSQMRKGDIDQGAINRGWKVGTVKGFWRTVKGLLCPMLNGTAQLGVLPGAQFLSLLGYSVRKLHVLRAVEPIAVHATFLRVQEPQGKLMRFREEGLYLDPPDYYESGSFMTYSPAIPPESLHQRWMAQRGSVPEVHIDLVRRQVLQLRSALAIARVLNRTLVLPRVRCACELGFGRGHIGRGCDAQSSLQLPYDCPVDHWLSPRRWLLLGWPHRERGFLENPRVPDEVLRSRAHARLCGPNQPPNCCLTSRGRLREPELLDALGRCASRVLDLGDVAGVFGGFSRSATADAQFNEQFGDTIANWCCTTDPTYTGGLVPYWPKPLADSSSTAGEASPPEPASLDWW